MRLRDMTGQTFGRLRVLGQAQVAPSTSRNRAAWTCQCECGSTVIVVGESLRSGNTLSCGCLRRDTNSTRRRSHGHTVGGLTKEYRTWASAKARCYNSASHKYPSYGGRGIAMSAEWREHFEAFYRDMGPCPPWASSLDRIDVNGNYERGNCRWATPYMQGNNTRQCVKVIDPQGNQVTLKTLARTLGFDYSSLHRLVRMQGIPLDVAMARIVAWRAGFRRNQHMSPSAWPPTA